MVIWSSSPFILSAEVKILTIFEFLFYCYYNETDIYFEKLSIVIYSKMLLHVYNAFGQFIIAIIIE